MEELLTLLYQIAHGLLGTIWEEFVHELLVRLVVDKLIILLIGEINVKVLNHLL